MESMKAVEVKKEDCQGFINSLCNGELAAVTVKQVKTVINQAFKYAVDHDILLRNYMGNVKVDEVKCKPDLKEDEDVVYNQEEIIALRKIIAETWEDIDFEKRKIKVTKTYSEQTLFDEHGNNLHKKIYTITPPKRKTSIRSVILCDEAIFWLKELKRRYEQKGRMSNYILATKSGKHLNMKIYRVP